MVFDEECNIKPFLVNKARVLARKKHCCISVVTYFRGYLLLRDDSGNDFLWSNHFYATELTYDLLIFRMTIIKSQETCFAAILAKCCKIVVTFVNSVIVCPLTTELQHFISLAKKGYNSYKIGLYWLIAANFTLFAPFFDPKPQTRI